MATRLEFHLHQSLPQIELLDWNSTYYKYGLLDWNSTYTSPYYKYGY